MTREHGFKFTIRGEVFVPQKSTAGADIVRAFNEAIEIRTRIQAELLDVPATLEISEPVSGSRQVGATPAMPDGPGPAPDPDDAPEPSDEEAPPLRDAEGKLMVPPEVETDRTSALAALKAKHDKILAAGDTKPEIETDQRRAAAALAEQQDKAGAVPGAVEVARDRKAGGAGNRRRRAAGGKDSSE